jgi:hypothetical protein
MIDPDEHVLRAFIRLNDDKDYAYLKTWLIDSYQAQINENVFLGNEVQSRWGQGKAQQLQEIVTLFIDARLLLDKIQKK